MINLSTVLAVDSSDFMDVVATQMEERFEEHVNKKFLPDQKLSISGVIYSAFGEKIKNCFKTPEAFSKEFRHYAKKKKFQVGI